MKVNLLLNSPADARHGYINIDPFIPEDSFLDGVRIVRGDVTNLDEMFDDGELSEIVANGVLEYFPAQMADDILGNWLKKLKRGGVVTVTALDIREVSRGCLSGELSSDDVNLMLYGSDKPIRSAFDLSQVSDALEFLGLKILRERIVGYRCVVTAEKQ